MRKPSLRVLIQRAAIYRAVKGQDRAGGPSYSYPLATAVNVPCTAQPSGYEEVEENGRLTQLRRWRLMFASDPGVNLRDKIVFADKAGVSHTVYVQASRDEAGRGAAYSVVATERT